MRVLVTGGSGLLGRHVVAELQNDYEVVILARDEPAVSGRYRWVQGDITDPDSCQRAVQGVDLVQHLAAQIWPTDHPGLDDMTRQHGLAPDTTVAVNVMGTYQLLSAAAATGVETVVMASSNCVLGHGFRLSGRPFPIDELPITENHPLAPEDSYGYSKLAAEELLATFSRAHGVRTFALRLAGIYPLERRHQLAASVGPTTGWNDFLWAWVSAEDAARAHRSIMEVTAPSGEHRRFFVNAPDTTSIEETPRLIQRHRPELEPIAREMVGHGSLISADQIGQYCGWIHAEEWRPLMSKGR